MTLGMIIFCIVIAVWVFTGFLMVCQAKSSRINYEGIIFVITFLLIPIIAHFCGLV